jgi:hypothetical protein
MSVIAEKHGLSFGDLRKNLTEFRQFLNKTKDLVSKLSGVLNEEINILHSMVLDIQKDFETAMHQAKLPSKSPRKGGAPPARGRDTDYQQNQNYNKDFTRTRNAEPRSRTESPRKPLNQAPQQSPQRQSSNSPKPAAAKPKAQNTPKKTKNEERPKVEPTPTAETTTATPQRNANRGRGGRGNRGNSKPSKLYQPKEKQ